jgi:signal transduction histidine kinase/DNA-binding NarL/FixJ family response regulator
MRAEPGRPFSLLVVDDDDVDRAAVRRALRLGGVTADVSEAVDFASGRTSLLEQRPDVVLLDFQLPGGDGLELLREGREQGIDSAVIVLTGQGDEALAVELMKAGASDYLPKHLLTPDRLAQSVRQVLRLRDADRRAHQAHHALERQARQLQSLARASLGIHAAPTLEEALDFISRTARELLGAHLAVARLDGAGGAPRVERRSVSEKYRGQGHQAGEDGMPEGGSPAGDGRKSVRLAERALAGDPALLAAWGRRFPGAQVRGVLAAPLVGRDGAPVGSLELTDRLEGDFDASDEAILLQLAQTASVALENARLYRAAQEATSAREDLLAIVSHDLRNPLNVVGMSASMLRSTLSGPPTDASAGRITLVQRIERNVARMNRLIEDLLDASQLEAGKLSVHPQPLKASVLVSEAVEAVGPLAEYHAVRLGSGPVDANLVVRADRERILQVLSNLLGNAIKFAPRQTGEVTISVAGDGARAVFSVSDNGPGIPEGDRAHLFERYWKGPTSSRESAGLGLGLFIAQGIIDAHGGEIRAESRAGGGPGTTFRFWLRLAS